ncbi:hypothetical protein FBR04_10430 [Betaproteobacteria bacterium PRO7]|nr:hypothetical protein [Burkholderiaceae bacterium]MDL1861429.1 hypothetical protein [Betaproteobacteria bacterium PRO7]
MPHAELAPLIDVVQRNCDLADARHAREKSMCTYLLDMREHFRWAAQLPLGTAPDRAQLSAWIARREQSWELLPTADAPFAPLPLGAGVDPFDDDAANGYLAEHGWVYGAGIGLFGAPLFFLAERASEQTRDGARVIVTEREWARGMTAPPAVSRGRTVIVRLDALRRWLWTRVEAGSRRAGDNAFSAALRAYAAADAAAGVERMARGETETLILHELGELHAGVLLGEDWESMIIDSPRRTEVVLRALRDLLADCLVTLPQLLARDAHASLLFWYATFDGLRRQLAPELAEPFRAEPDRIDRAALADAARTGASRWLERASGLQAAWQRGGSAALAQAADALCPRQ